MSLREATLRRGKTPPLPPGPPYPCAELTEWAGVAFELPPGDPRLLDIHNGEPADTPALENIQGIIHYWSEFPEYMAFLEPDSPIHRDKVIERALYLDLWRPHLKPGARVMDLGGGVGRFTQWLLDEGCEVELVDPDLHSLWRAVSQAAGRKGSLDVHWSTGEAMPDLAPFDAIVAAEVLCYAEDPARIVQNCLRALKPGGALLCSVEARWGWAMAMDAAPGTLEAFLTDGIVHVPGDRWVRTYTREDFEALLSPLEGVEIRPSHYTFSGPFETSCGDLTAEQALAMDARLRAHPVSAPLNRVWMAIARKPDK